MQYCGSTNKSPIKLNAAENKLDTVICLRMGKTSKAKPHRVNLRSLLLRIHYYQSQVVTSKGIPIPYTNLQLNPYPNTQLDLYCSGNLSVQCKNPSM